MTADSLTNAGSGEKNQNSSVIDLQSVTGSNAKLTEAGYEKPKKNTANPTDEVYDPFSNRDTTHLTSDFGAFVHLFKGSFGSGILAVPLAFKNGGLIFGLVGTMLMGMLCAHCVTMLVKCAHILSVRDKKPSLSFEQTAEIAFKTGPRGIQKYSTLARQFVTVSLFSTYYLGNTVYIVLVSEAFRDMINHYGGKLDIRICILIVACLIVPLGIGRTLKFLVPISAFGIVFIAFGLAVTMYHSLTTSESDIVNHYITADPINELPVFFSTIVFAMEGIGTVLPIEKSMKKPEHFRGYFGVLSTAMAMIVILYSTIGFVCYLRFGQKTESNITSNLPHDGLSEVVKLMVALSILFTYGLQFCVPSEIVWDQIKLKISSKYDNLAYYLMRGGLILGTIVIALIIPTLGPFIGLVGALCLATLGLFIPSVIEIVTFWEESANNWRLAKNVFIMIFSLMVTVSGSCISIQTILKESNKPAV